MKTLLLSVLLFLSFNLQAADLSLELPRAEWLLPAGSPPLLQREGTVLVTEQEKAQRLVQFIDTAQLEEGLAYMRTEYPDLLELLESGDPEAALPQRVVAGGFMPGAQRNQVSAIMLYLVGHCYLALGRFEPAETAFKAALGPLPDYVRAHEALGLLYLQSQRPEEAREHLSRAAALGLNTPNLFGALGYLNQEVNNYWGAVSAYQQALVMDPDNVQWQQGLLYSLSRTYQYDSALTLAEQMLQEDPSEPELWLYRSQLSLQAGERQAALTSLETAIRLGENLRANLQVAATLHMEFGSINRAVELLRSGVEQGIEYQFIDQALAWLVQREEWDYLEELLTAVQARRDTLNAVNRSKLLTREAGLALHNDATANARTALQQALELDPGNADALMTLAGIQRDARNYTQAELLYQRASAYELYRDNALIAMAQLAIDQDNFERALQLLREVVAGNPGRSDLERNITSLENLVLLQE